VYFKPKQGENHAAMDTQKRQTASDLGGTNIIGYESGYNRPRE
jgi:hypothetical protein